MSANAMDRIQSALAAGRLSVPDEYGMQHTVSAHCPNDGHSAPVYRTESTGEGAVTRAVFRCPFCGHQFEVAPEEMFLR